MTNTTRNRQAADREDQYGEFITPDPEIPTDRQVLPEPAPMIVIRTFTTYGAYEEPIG